jgi:hypothetical protein
MNMALQTSMKTKSTPALVSTLVNKSLLQRKCPGCITHSNEGELDEYQKKGFNLQRRSANEAAPPEVPQIVHDVLRSPGEPLDRETRAFMEPRFGHDFSKVRIHTDAKAAESAWAVNALAYTVGKNVVFGAGQYAPGTTNGQRLMVHELTHVMQQGITVFPSGNLSLDTAGSAAENEAEHLSGEMASINSAISTVPSGKVQRQFITPLSQGGGFGGLMERDRQAAMAQSGGATGPVIYMCSKALDTSPVGRHAFFRIGGSGKGNPTISLQPIDTLLADCWQGVPDKDYPSDYNADAQCEPTAISKSCLEREFSAYPIGHYCTFGPNSNTFVGHVARRCGISNPDPPGWTPGIDDSPPPSGTYAPSKWDTLTGCKTKTCLTPPGPPRPPIA